MRTPRHKFPFPLTIEAMADHLGITRTHLSEVLHHKTQCSPKLAARIERATNGEIKKESLIWPEAS